MQTIRFVNLKLSSFLRVSSMSTWFTSSPPHSLTLPTPPVPLQIHDLLCFTHMYVFIKTGFWVHLGVCMCVCGGGGWLESDNLLCPHSRRRLMLPPALHVEVGPCGISTHTLECPLCRSYTLANIVSRFHVCYIGFKCHNVCLLLMKHILSFFDRFEKWDINKAQHW